MKNKEIYMYRISVWFIGLIIFFLASCSQTSVAPIPITEPDPAEESVFSTLDLATPLNDEGSGLAVSGNNLYVVGHTEGDLDGTNQGDNDGFLRGYNGGKLWGTQFGTRATDYTTSVATDSNGYIYVLGYTFGPLGFQLGSGDIFLVKFNKDGKHIWIRQFGTKNNDRATDLAIDSDDRIYVLSDEGDNNFVIRKFSTGGSLLKTKSVTLNTRPDLTPRAITVDSLNNVIVLTSWKRSGKTDARLFKYKSNLSELWQNNYGKASHYDFPSDVITDSNNNIYFTVRTNALNHGGKLVKKDANGNTLYTRRLEYSPTSFDTFPVSITIDSNDNIYVAAETYGAFPGFKHAGITDIVVFKYNSDGARQWVNQLGLENYGSEDWDEVSDIAVNDSGVYVTGETEGNLLTGSEVSHGAYDAYLVKIHKGNGEVLGVDQ